MRFLHLADLHIGKRVNGFSMIEDQKFVFEQVYNVIENEKIDGIIMAGIFTISGSVCGGS